MTIGGRAYAADASIISISRRNEPSGSMAKCALASAEATQHTFAPAERPDYKLVVNTPADR